MYDQYTLQHGEQRTSLGGNQISMYLMDLLTGKSNHPRAWHHSYQRRLKGDKIKINLCHVAQTSNFNDELQNIQPIEYELPDGQVEAYL